MRLSVPLRSVAALCAAFLCACSDGGPSGPSAPTRIEFAADSAMVRINTSVALQPSALDARGTALPGVTFRWASSDPAVAEVSAEGVVTARSYGTAIVSARAGALEGRVTVVVTGTPGVRVVSGAGVEDTISAIPAQPLVVELRDSLGLARPGVVLTFSGRFVVSGAGSPEPSMLVARTQGGEFAAISSALTDAAGKASIQVRMGTVAGPATILVADPTQRLADTARFVVRPGAPTRVVMAPRDTAVFRGRTMAVRAAVLDRGRNPVPVQPSFSVLSASATVNAQGQVAGAAYGEARVVAQLGAAADTVRVAVLPEGAIAAASTFGLGIINLDGTGLRVLNTNDARSPAWSPDGTVLTYQSGFYGYLVTHPLNGAPRPLVSASATGSHWPIYSRDGQWIYYFTTTAGPYAVVRVHPDGTGSEAVPGTGPGAGHASPSPDGSRVVYFEEGVRAQIRVGNVRTGERSAPLTPGHSPSWSPTADLIAFNELRTDIINPWIPAGIMVMRPDGTGLRRVAEGRYDYSPRWSPDGRWIIAVAGGRVKLIEVETGLIITVPAYIEAASSADWKPGALLP